MNRILVIDKCQQDSKELSSVLERAGFQVIAAEGGQTGLRKLCETHPKMIIMANDSAEEQKLCPRIRDISDIPIIVLGRGDEIRRALVLALGADAYIIEPASPFELVARVKSLLRRYNKLNAGNPYLGWETNCVEPEGLAVKLTGTQFRLASCLLLNKGRLLDYTQLISEVWGGRR